MDGNCISPVLLTAVAAMVSALFGAFIWALKDSAKSRDAQIADLSTRLTEATKRLQTGVAVMAEAETELRTRAGGRRR